MIRQLEGILKKQKKIVVGLMSGTSMDGIDAAIVELEGTGVNTKVRLIEFDSYPYLEEERKQVLQLCSPETGTVDHICEMNVVIGKRFSEAVEKVIKKSGLEHEEVDFISSHGQTIYHMPEKQATFQIGELAVIAAETGCLTVGDFRPADMAAGGQGAPLVPFVDYVLFRSEDKGRVLMNIGGISNLTVMSPGVTMEGTFAFDTGPGNILIDWMVEIGTRGKFTFDEGGEIGARGLVNEEWLSKILEQDNYIHQKPPKSTGRELYTKEFAQLLWNEGVENGLGFEDIVATITTYTAKSIGLNFQKFISDELMIDEVLIGGGGIHNRFLMQQLRKEVNLPITTMEEWGFSSDAKEAIAFAILGNEFLHGNHNNLPSATGSRRKVRMGKLALP